MAKKSTKTSYPVKYLNKLNKCVYTIDNEEEEKKFKSSNDYVKVT